MWGVCVEGLAGRGFQPLGSGLVVCLWEHNGGWGAGWAQLAEEEASGCPLQGFMGVVLLCEARSPLLEGISAAKNVAPTCGQRQNFFGCLCFQDFASPRLGPFGRFLLKLW